MARMLMVCLLLVATAAGCSENADDDDARKIVGIVIDIRSGSGFGEVESFTVKEGSEEIEVFVDADATYDFPLGHLNAHRTGAGPVRVEAVERDGKLVATEIGDA